MQQFIFIRHGESTSNAGSSEILPNADIPLTLHAHLLVQDLADQWKIAPRAIYTSEFIRTQQTAKPLCQKYGINPIALSTLNECDIIGFDVAEKLPAKEKLPLIKRYWQESNPHERIGKKGETYHDFCERVASFKSQLSMLENHSIIVGHGMWFAQFLWQTLNLGNHQPTQKEMQQFGHFFLHLPINNLAKFDIHIANNHLSICKRNL